MTILESCISPYISKDGNAYACGQCPACRKKKSMEWAIRGSHELYTQPKAVFVTLTYCEEKLHKEALFQECEKDALGVLNKEDYRNFMKKLRKHYPDKKLKYIQCGEYGPKTWRPHHHAIIWGLSPDEVSRKFLKRCWGMGNVHKSDNYVTDFSIQYVIGYIRKKFVHNSATEHYKNNNRLPPYMSASQGIGREWALKNLSKWARTGTIGYRGFQMPVPRYYIKLAKQMEGRKIRYKIIKRTPSGVIKKEYWEYKYFENPNGYFTEMINRTLSNNKIKHFKDFVENNEINSKDEVKYLKHIKKLEAERTYEKILIHEINKRLSDIGLSDLYRKDIREKTIDKSKNTSDNNKLICDDNYKLKRRLKSKARYKNYKISNGYYGARDMMETLQEMGFDDVDF